MMRKMAGLLVVCGLGCEPERDATLEALAALASCEERFAVLSPRRKNWLSRRVGAVKSAKNAAAVVRAAKKKQVGLAVWGHATLTSQFAREALAAAEKMGVEAVVLASLSPAGHAIGASARSLGWRADEDDGWSTVPAGAVPKGPMKRPLAVFDELAETLIVALPGKRRE
jgi:hypothetical protein